MTVRVTRTYTDVAGTVPAPTNRVIRFGAQVLTLPEPSIERTVEQTAIFSGQTSYSPVERTISQTVVFTGTATIGFTKPVSQTAVFSQSVDVIATGLEVTNDLVMSQTVNDPPTEEDIVQTAVFSQSSINSIKSIGISQTILFWDLVVRTEWNRSVSQTVVLSGTADKVLILVGAIPRTTSQTFEIRQNAVWIFIERTVYHDLILSQSVSIDYIWQTEQEIIFTDAVVDNKVLPIPVTSNIIFNHAFLADRQASECVYDPIFGGGEGGTTMPAGIPNRLVRQSNVKLVYPAVLTPSSWTYTATLRNPEIGDRTKLQMDRIFRESRGGTLQTYRKDTWPTNESVSVAIRLTQDQAVNDFMDFIDNTLGAEIGFLDWEGNAWKGVMQGTADPIVRTHNNLIDITFELVIIGALE